MKRRIILSTGLALLSCAATLQAAGPRGFRFTYGFWEVACDNTRTCRAAGYGEGGPDDKAEADPIPVSVLLTRKAGPNAPIQAELQIANPGEGEPNDALPHTLALTMTIDDQPYGEVVITQGRWIVALTPAQSQALVGALAGDSRIAWSDGRHTWRLGEEGGAAVLLKMDEFQGRLGTPGALIRKGDRDENGVLPPVPPPVVVAAAVPAGGQVSLPDARIKTMLERLRAKIEDCQGLPTSPEERLDLTVYRLSATKLLASMDCWRGAYNQGAAYWVINARPPYAPVLVTTSGSGYASGQISGSQKLRGMGDCAWLEDWTWDGRRFVHTSQGTTGECRAIAPDGAWTLPELVTEVRWPRKKS